MNHTTLQPAPSNRAKVSLARLSQPHGYRFDGDNVHLHARFTVVDHAANQRAWSLQLWACPSAPTSAEDLAGQIVAEVALPPMSEIADEVEHVDLSAFARPPAGNAEHFMALVLASGSAGQFDEIHDIAAYPCRQRFKQPGMRGSVGYRIEGNRVHLSVEQIENPRASSNCSGTLALELWAMTAPYHGGAPKGLQLAGVVIGSLFGQNESTSSAFHLPFTSPPAGDWHFVLLLREWTAAGYVTRDFTNFVTPVTYGLPPATTSLNAPAPLLAEAISDKPTKPTEAASTTLHPKVAGKPVAKVATNPRKTSAAKHKKSLPIAPAAVPTAASVSLAVSVNTAIEEELAAVKGLSPKLAQAIRKARPYASLDDLLRVKGISETFLAGIRSRLKL